MRIFTHKNVENWDVNLSHVEMYLNGTPTVTAGISPYKIVYGRDMNLPIDLTVSDSVPQVKHTLE